ncbi:SOS-response transcriptional repressor, LexA [Caminicella sporogenes DSM 14501]|uniref:LexA repressor n=1 Tax=Caminicella sporogenes DSM 14501 TaxID=1121266 RepID=A0A1M6L666_9FIRM|nr:transcriptional repressor LexA [Caminicella sporogenes]RKD27720.1 repressor LexA [Caminicella sporogenes]SHJ66711.1 SOS-response transcriptional repressor, LexA [Caminicella sporogenes DSM 14501]
MSSDLTKQRPNLTKQQSKILNFIKQEIQKKGYPPSVREICEAVGLRSTSTVHGHLTRLERKGYIRRDPTKPRAIEVLNFNRFISENKEKEIANIPIIGKVTAGQPILAVENVEETFPVPIDFIDSGNYFILKISGDSMIKAGILNDDFVLVKQQSDANNGDIVVALLEDSATVKRFFKEDNYIKLQPENDFMNPIIVNDVRILGIVKGVFRKL